IVVGNRRAAGSATDTPCAECRGSRLSLRACPCRVDDRPTWPAGSTAPDAPIRHRSDHSDSVRLSAYRSCGAASSTCRIIPKLPRHVPNHTTKACATGFWVRLLDWGEQGPGPKVVGSGGQRRLGRGPGPKLLAWSRRRRIGRWKRTRSKSYLGD